MSVFNILGCDVTSAAASALTLADFSLFAIKEGFLFRKLEEGGGKTPVFYKYALIKVVDIFTELASWIAGMLEVLG